MEIESLTQLNHVLFNEPRSGIRAISELALSDYAGSDLIFLGYGQPDLALQPSFVNQIKSIDLSRIPYTLNRGDPELIDAIVARFSRKNISIDKENVFVTSGATHALALVVGCIINHGDEVLLPSPGYPTYSSVVKHYGGIPAYYDLDTSNGCVPDVSKLRRLFTEKTKAIIVNSPSNPIGSVLSPTSMSGIVDLAREHNLFLISDEVYDELIFYGGQHYYPISVNCDHVVSIFSLSKTHNLCGLRIGYAITRNEELLRLMLSSQEMYISCANYLGQKIATLALNDGSEYVSYITNIFSARCDRVCSGCLKELIYYQPNGTFYILLNIKQYNLGSMEFCKKLLAQEQVVLSPGSAFGPNCDHLVRMSLIQPVDTIGLACERISRFLSQI